MDPNECLASSSLGPGGRLAVPFKLPLSLLPLPLYIQLFLPTLYRPIHSHPHPPRAHLLRSPSSPSACRSLPPLLLATRAPTPNLNLNPKPVILVNSCPQVAHSSSTQEKRTENFEHAAQCVTHRPPRYYQIIVFTSTCPLHLHDVWLGTPTIPPNSALNLKMMHIILHFVYPPARCISAAPSF